MASKLKREFMDDECPNAPGCLVMATDSLASHSPPLTICGGFRKSDKKDSRVHVSLGCKKQINVAKSSSITEGCLGWVGELRYSLATPARLFSYLPLQEM